MILNDTQGPPEKQQHPDEPLARPPGGPSSTTSNSQLSWTFENQDVASFRPPPAYDAHETHAKDLPNFQHAQRNPGFHAGPQYPASEVMNYGGPHRSGGYIQQAVYPGYVGGSSVGVQQQGALQHPGTGQTFLPSSVAFAPHSASGWSHPSYSTHPSSVNASGRPTKNQFFQPFALISHTSDLQNGFPGDKPPSNDHPHPFTTHEVKQEDWIQFLTEIQEVERGSTGDQIAKGLIDVVGRLPIAGRLMSMGLDTQARDKRSSPVGQIISRWNQGYFHPRLIDVVLAQGRTCHTGPPNAVPADMHHLQHHRRSNHSGSRAHDDSDDSYSSDESVRGVRLGMMSERREAFGMGLRAGRKERKERRRELKRERKHARRDAKRGITSASDEKWRLVIGYKPVDEERWT